MEIIQKNFCVINYQEGIAIAFPNNDLVKMEELRKKIEEYKKENPKQKMILLEHYEVLKFLKGRDYNILEEEKEAKDLLNFFSKHALPVIVRDDNGKLVGEYALSC